MATLAKGEKKALGSTPLEALTYARALIEKPENWCQSDWGENGQHCMTAALSRSTKYELHAWERALGFLCEAADSLGRAAKQSLMNWNDTHTHAEVLAAYDLAIAQAMGGRESIPASTESD